MISCWRSSITSVARLHPPPLAGLVVLGIYKEKPFLELSHAKIYEAIIV